MMDELFNVSTKHIKGPTLPHQDEEIKLLRWSVHDFITKRILPALSTTTPVRVLEVGPARVPHGHQPEYFVDIRAEILKMGHSYISLDIIEGADVDIVDDVVRLLEHVDKWSFDLIIALEVLEHVKELWKIPHIFFDALDNKGIFLVSTPFYRFSLQYRTLLSEK